MRPAPIAPPVRLPATDAAAGPPRSRDLAVTLALALAGILPPIAFTALPEALSLIGPLPTAISLIGALLLAPVAVGAVTALLGLERVRSRVRARADKEHEHAIWRVLTQTLLLAYALGLAAIEPDSAAAAPCLLVAILALVAGWTFLLHVILTPAPSAVRRNAAIAIDLGLLSAFLHFGQGETASWYPLYLVAAFYAGLRLGFGALIVSAASGLVGFAAMVATTAFWQQQPGLAAGLTIALVAMPGGVALLIRTVARSREEAAAASAARAQFITAIGRGLRGPVDAMARAIPGAEPTALPEAATVALPARALLSQISEVLDLAAIESGDFAPEIEPFDLHAIVNDTLAVLRGAAAQHGVALALRLDPHVPYRLCGWPQQVAQILNSLVIAAIAGSESGTVWVEIGAVNRSDGVVQLRLTIRTQGGGRAMPGSDSFDLAVVRRLVELMGGRITTASAAEPGARWTVVLPLAIDDATVAPPLDLAQRPVLLVTEDSQFAGELAEPLNAWNADTRWIGGLDDALVYVERFETPHCPVLIVDGRSRVIPALSFVHRAALAREEPPFLLFVAEAAQLGSLAELDDGELTGLLPAPLSDRILENALHALPLIPAEPLPDAVPIAPVAVATAPDFGDVDDRVTPIAAHPRFVPEPTALVDARVIAGLRALGTGDFLGEVIDSFRADSRQIMERIAAATGAADAAAFARGVHALRRCAATLGGARLCELAVSLRDVTAAELRQQGDAIIQRLSAELARLDAALLEFLPRAGEMRR